jgi:2'-5' RNA ligase
MKRLFIAIKVLPGEALQRLFNFLQTELSEYPIKWVNTGHLHITLLFLGNTDENEIPLITLKLRQIALMFTQFSFNIQCLGVFYHKAFPKVIWAGIGGDGNQLALLSAKVTESLTIGNSYGSSENFKAHLTLGRVRDKRVGGKKPDSSLIKKLDTSIESFSGTIFQHVRVNSFELLESKLQPQGAVYHSLEKFELNS